MFAQFVSLSLVNRGREVMKAYERKSGESYIKIDECIGVFSDP
jgi:hypothetical protein